MHIKRIVLKNFQSHSYTVLNLSDKINVFLGKGNRGKSSIIRALKWIFFNEPKGIGFIRKGETFASCSITLDNGYTIVRERDASNKINRYLLITPENKRIEYSNFGREIPTEIKKILKIENIPVESGINLSPQIKEQMENVYLINETPSTLHTILLTISGGQNIDEAIKSLATDLERLTRREKEIKSELEDREKLMKEYEGIDELKNRILKIKDEINQVKEIQDKKSRLIDIKNSFSKIRKEIEEISFEYQNLRDVEKISDKFEYLNNKKTKYENLKNLKEKLEKVRFEIEKVKKQKKLFEDKEIDEEVLKDILTKTNRLLQIKDLFNRLKLYRKEIEENIKDKKELENTISESIKDYLNLISKEGVCPLCLREIDLKSKKEIEENIKKLWR